MAEKGRAACRRRTCDSSFPSADGHRIERIETFTRKSKLRRSQALNSMMEKVFWAKRFAGPACCSRYCGSLRAIFAAEVRDIRVAATDTGTAWCSIFPAGQHNAFLLDDPRRVVRRRDQVLAQGQSCRPPKGPITAMRTASCPTAVCGWVFEVKGTGHHRDVHAGVG
jgi:hypothetical protein